MAILSGKIQTRITERFAVTFPSDRSELAVFLLKYPERGRGFTVKLLPSFLLIEVILRD